jgi:tetratricopeptide (TPR) repeat protein
MRATILLVVGALAAVPASAQMDAASDGGTDVAVVEEGRESRLNSLFSTLQSTSDEAAAKAAENDIIEIWLNSGSDTIDLLMNWTIEAIERKNYPLALDYLDRMIALRPDYAEAWNKRATVHFLVDDYAKAIADIEQTLAREPRHFGALSGLGTIMRDIGEEDRALTAFRQALEIDPYLDNVKEAVAEIEAEAAGEEI